jgi:membrane-bound inhibitor of C-type lysozyme
MSRLSIAAIASLALGIALGGCAQRGPAMNWTPIARPSPDDLVPQGIAYICEGRKEVAVVYAKNRASVTFGEKTWRAEYQGMDTSGFRYADATVEWSGHDELATLRERGNQKPLAFNCRPTRKIT